jgi:hypothetical protein
MSYNYNTPTNYYASYRLNPENLSGSDRAFAERHNANISNIKISDSRSKSCSYSDYAESGSPNSSATSSGSYITHSYYGNSGHVITTCIG